MILSILICHLYNRKLLLDKLLFELRAQISKGQYRVEILVDAAAGTVGRKRQRLLQQAQGDYICFIDDDDEVSPDYLESIVPILGTTDAVGFSGEITTNGRNKKLFIIGKDNGYEEKEGVYYRFNNHLSPVRREIALQIGFKDVKFMEDYDYAFRLKESGLVKTEIYIDKILYQYKYLTRKIHR